MINTLRQQSVALFVLGTGVAATLAGWYVVGRQAEGEAKTEFASQAAVATNVVERRIQRYVDLLYGLDALANHEPNLTRLEFHSYTVALDLGQRLPGVQAVEFLRRVREPDREGFVLMVRNDRSLSERGYPEFHIKPPGIRPEYWVIDYVEPMKGNESAFGLDVLQRRGARDAAERSRDTGSPVFTGKYRLAQEPAASFGLVMYLPVYSVSRPTTTAQRRQHHVGFVNVVLRVEDLMAGMMAEPIAAGLQIRIHDRGALGATRPISQDTLFYSTPGGNNALEVASAVHEWRPTHSSDLALGGRQWELEFAGPVARNPFLRTLPLVVLIGGLVFSAMLYLILRGIARARNEAIALARRATDDLRKQLSFTQQLIEAMPNPVFYKDAEGRYLGCNAAFEDYAAQQGGSWQPEQPADRALAQFTERLLASAIGAASARLTLTSALRGSGMELGEVVALLDEANQELRFNRQILSTTLENISQGVSAVDAEMRLVAWNRGYQTLFGYPDGMLYVGRPVSELIRWNADRGELGAGDAEAQVQRRLDHLRAGTPHVFERVRASGQVIEMRGQPLPGGGYVTTYSDVTDYKRAEHALLEANETLEQRVELRTREADAAQQSKARFLAAVSHDVLQPLNAARLFTSALRESHDHGEQTHLAERVDASLRAAEDLLDGLLDISRLDAGALRPEPSDFDAGELLHELAAQYAPIAADRGLRLRVHVTGGTIPVRTDRRLLRRALQNFLANAVRYTRNKGMRNKGDRGGVLLAARPRDGAVALEVWDTGPGIPVHHLAQIFDEFRRFEQPGIGGERGLGLGLSICQRIAHTLEHPLTVRSRVGRGSVFTIRVPHGVPQAARERVADAIPDSLAGLRVLCVDNDREILDGMRALLERWGVVVLTATTADEALALMSSSPDVALVDYHLHDRLDGLGVVVALRAQVSDALPAALLTGDGSDALKLAAREHGCAVLTKPVKPASLRAFLAAQKQATSA